MTASQVIYVEASHKSTRLLLKLVQIHNLDLCDSDPCQNGGTCMFWIKNNDAVFNCTCPSGHYGETCEKCK